MTDHYWLKEAIILDVHTKDSFLIWERHAQDTIIKHGFSLLNARKVSKKLQQGKRTAGSCTFQMEKLVSLIMDEPVRKYFRKDRTHPSFHKICNLISTLRKTGEKD